MGKVLGLDVGERKIGMAIGNPEHSFVFLRPALIVDNWEQVWPELQQLVKQESIETIVLGLPYNADGTEGNQARQVKKFAEQLGQKVTAQIAFHDERSTTKAVHREQQNANRKLKPGEEDSLAAQLILEGYLEGQPQ